MSKVHHFTYEYLLERIRVNTYSDFQMKWVIFLFKTSQEKGVLCEAHPTRMDE